MLDIGCWNPGLNPGLPGSRRYCSRAIRGADKLAEKWTVHLSSVAGVAFALIPAYQLGPDASYAAFRAGLVVSIAIGLYAMFRRPGWSGSQGLTYFVTPP